MISQKLQKLSATDNCDDVLVTMTETCMGDCPEEGDSDCELITPVRPAGNVCNYPVDWAMALFAMPQMLTSGINWIPRFWFNGKPW
jgi:hypothetical protein